MQTVVETETYLRDTKAAKLSDGERRQIVNFIAANPDAGHEIPGTGGARKVRFAGKGKGKSGGCGPRLFRGYRRHCAVIYRGVETPTSFSLRSIFSFSTNTPT